MIEDAAIELEAFAPGGRIFCIASAGCTARHLAAQHEVVAVDINPVQLAYARRRLNGGPAERGSAERLVEMARSLGFMVGWSRPSLRRFLALDNLEEQVLYWRRHLDTFRFRAAFGLLLSRPFLRSIYAASLLTALPPNLGAVIRSRLERGIARHPNRTNPYARTLFLQDPDRPAPSPGRANVELHCDDAARFLERQPAGSFSAFTLSNILDGATVAYAQRLAAAVSRVAVPGARIVLRSFREPFVEGLTNQAADDRAMIWGIVHVLSPAQFAVVAARW